MDGADDAPAGPLPTLFYGLLPKPARNGGPPVEDEIEPGIPSPAEPRETELERRLRCA